MRGPRSENTERMVDYDDFTSKALAGALASAGLATSGNKGVRAARLAEAGIAAERILVDPDGRVTIADSTGSNSTLLLGCCGHQGGGDFHDRALLRSSIIDTSGAERLV